MTARTENLHVWIDQDLCTGDGLCARDVPEIFQFDVDGLAYVKDGHGDLRHAPGSSVEVPGRLHLDVIDAARQCPGACIHVLERPPHPTAGRDQPAPQPTRDAST